MLQPRPTKADAARGTHNFPILAKFIYWVRSAEVCAGARELGCCHSSASRDLSLAACVAVGAAEPAIAARRT